jgi:transcriptional regulator with XRE-family HTH domain
MARPNSRDPRKDPKALLGKRLRRLRVAAGFASAEAAAKAMGYVREVISKTESGERTPTDPVFEKWLKVCNATPEQRESLAEDLELARHSEPVVPEFAEAWLNAEAEASYIRLWALFVMPGLLQTYDYANAMFLMGGLDEDKATAKAAARVKRQVILDGPDATRLTVLLSEPLLHRLVGTPEIMVQELTHLLEMSKRPNVIIQVVRDGAYFPGHEGQFEIASGHTIPDTLNMITVMDQTTTDRAMADPTIVLFERIRGYALPIEETRALIQEALERWKGQLQ